MKRIEHLMGTVFTIEVYDIDVNEHVVDAAFEWLLWVDRTFSTFRDDSEISRIGRGDLSIEQASSEVRHVLQRCEEIETATEQRFSIRPGHRDGPGLDPAGFVKGWSVDEAALILQTDGVSRFMIDAGGDVLCVGQPRDGDEWTIGIRHPESPERSGAVLGIPSGAVATSGTYLRGEHIRGSHVEAPNVTSVTVVGRSLGMADALATAIYGDQATSLAWMSRFPEYGVALMTADHRLRWTEQLDGSVGTIRSQPEIDQVGDSPGAEVGLAMSKNSECVIR